MKYYEILYPYYALIQANSEEAAVQEYIYAVAGEQKEFDELMEEIKVVPEYYAAAKFSRGKGEGQEFIDINEVIDTLKIQKTQVLLIDGSLI